jgi:hypothetical protein
MAQPDYPDRADWPRYWSAIRRTAVRLVAGAAAAVGLTALYPAIDHPWRLAILIVIAFVVAGVVDRIGERLLQWWDRRLEGS